MQPHFAGAKLCQQRRCAVERLQVARHRRQFDRLRCRVKEDTIRSYEADCKEAGLCSVCHQNLRESRPFRNCALFAQSTKKPGAKAPLYFTGLIRRATSLAYSEANTRNTTLYRLLHLFCGLENVFDSALQVKGLFGNVVVLA